MRKKVLISIGVIVILIVFSTIMISILTSNNMPIESNICDKERNFPYQYKHSPPYNETEISVFPSEFSYTNNEISWMFSSSTTPLIVIVMNAENYYKYEKWAFHRENGDFICNDGQFLPYVEYFMLNDIPSLSGNGTWKAPYLDWWCLTFVNSEFKPFMVFGWYSFGCTP